MRRLLRVTREFKVPRAPAYSTLREAPGVSRLSEVPKPVEASEPLEVPEPFEPTKPAEASKPFEVSKPPRAETPKFMPRQTFEPPDSIPTTYFLPHHHHASSKILTVLSNISLVIECRDFRIPLTTHNPQLMRTLRGREHILLFTKRDLGLASPEAENRLREIYGDRIMFWDQSKKRTTQELLQRIKEVARSVDSLTGMRVLVVGMPNVGKSTLINAMRKMGMPGKKAKVATTGDVAGITRKVGTPVRIFENEEKGGVADGVYVVDTPGIFNKYVGDGEKMIKLALTQAMKTGLISSDILADYLLYRMNLYNPKLYRQWSPPTNDIHEFLLNVAKKEGKLRAGGNPHWPDIAARVLYLWRHGKLGKFVLDDLSDESISAHELRVAEPPQSMNQMKKQRKQKLVEAKSRAA